MQGDSEYGFCGTCLKEGDITTTYFHYNIKCDCHSPNHFEIVWHCPTCEPQEPQTTQITLKTKELKNL